MNSVITIDLNEFDLIHDNSIPFGRYYRMKEQYLRTRTQCDLWIEYSKEDTSANVYIVDSIGNRNFLFSGYYDFDTKQISGNMFDYWT